MRAAAERESRCGCPCDAASGAGPHIAGVLWHAGHELPRVSATLAALRKAGKRLFFVTNNSTKSRAQYRLKFEKLGIQAAVEEIYCSVRVCSRCDSRSPPPSLRDSRAMFVPCCWPTGVLRGAILEAAAPRSAQGAGHWRTRPR